MRVAATMRPPYSENANEEVVRIRIDADEESCESSYGARLGSKALAGLVTGTVRLSGTKSPRQAAVTPCESSDTLTLSLDREKGSATPTAVEILVMEEPPVAGLDTLPPAGDARPQQVAPAPAAPKPVVGGPTFSSAPRIAPGSWKETFVSGETLFYRIPVGWGNASDCPLHRNQRQSPTRFVGSPTTHPYCMHPTGASSARPASATAASARSRHSR